MAYEFGLDALSPNLLNLAEECLHRLQQQSVPPFSLPQKGFTIGQAELILAAEQWIYKARKRLHAASNPDAEERGVDDLGKTDLERFHEKFTRIMAAFCRGEGSSLDHSGYGDSAGNKKTTDAPSNIREEMPSQVLDNNLRLSYEVSAWISYVVTQASDCPQEIYEGYLIVSKERFKRLKHNSQPPYLFPQREYTLEQAKMRLGVEHFAKESYKAFHSAFDSASFPADRKESLHELYRKFNPQGDNEPQPNIKSFLGLDFFHRKNPTEVLRESQDFWETPEGKVGKK